MKKKFTVLDIIFIPFHYCPLYSTLIVIGNILLGIIPTIQTLVVAKFLDSAIKSVTDKSNFNKVIIYVVLLIVLLTIMWLSKSLKELFAMRLELELRKTFRTEITLKREKLEYHYIENAKTWDLISRISENPENRLKNAYLNILDFLALVLQVVGLIFIFITYVWQVSIIMTVLFIPLFLISYKGGKKNYLIKQKTQKFHRRHEYLGDVLINRDAAQERILFNFGRGVSKLWHKYYEKARKIELKKQLIWFARSKAGGVVTTIIAVLVSVFLSFAVVSGDMEIGMFISLITSLYALVDSMVWSLTNYVEQIADNREYMIDFTEFLNLREISSEPSQSNTEIIFESLELRNLRFKYPDTDRYILNGISYKFERGKSYALVGSNGAGKSTLIKLLIGLYDNYDGEILLNGKNIRNYDKGVIQMLFSCVFQDFARYSLSIKENIKIGNLASYDNITDSQLQQTASYIGLDELISNLSDGIDTKLGKIYENGLDVSGGQWQKIALARAMIRNSNFYILDEPTSALDPISESNLYSTFHKISQGKTLVLISHRLGSTKIADKILVMDNGKLVDEGTHKQLMDKNGLYAKMFESQRYWYEES